MKASHKPTGLDWEAVERAAATARVEAANLRAVDYRRHLAQR